MTNEIWKPVVGFGGAYEVSSLGRVRSLDRTIEQPTPSGRGVMVRRWKGRVLRPVRRERGGYLSVVLSKQSKLTSFLVHELVAAAFLGRRPAGMWVAHNDGNPSNNAVSNLRYDTPAGNHADKLQHGTLLHSEQHHNARLTTEEVQEIRKLYGTMPLEDLAARYGINKNHAYRIHARKRWSHV